MGYPNYFLLVQGLHNVITCMLAVLLSGSWLCSASRQLYVKVWTVKISDELVVSSCIIGRRFVRILFAFAFSHLHTNGYRLVRPCTLQRLANTHQERLHSELVHYHIHSQHHASCTAETIHASLNQTYISKAVHKSLLFDMLMYVRRVCQWCLCRIGYFSCCVANDAMCMCCVVCQVVVRLHRWHEQVAVGRRGWGRHERT